MGLCDFWYYLLSEQIAEERRKNTPVYNEETKLWSIYCQAITREGKQCSNKGKPEYCHTHSKKKQEVVPKFCVKTESNLFF